MNLTPRVQSTQIRVSKKGSYSGNRDYGPGSRSTCFFDTWTLRVPASRGQGYCQCRPNFYGETCSVSCPRCSVVPTSVQGGGTAHPTAPCSCVDMQGTLKMLPYDGLWVYMYIRWSYLELLGQMRTQVRLPEMVKGKENPLRVKGPPCSAAGEIHETLKQSSAPDATRK